MMSHGQYVNPGNSGFKRILNSEYMDKIAMISRVNSRIDSPEGCGSGIYDRNPSHKEGWLTVCYIRLP